MRRASILPIACVAAAFIAWRIRCWIRISRQHPEQLPGCSTGASLLEINRRFYDSLWSGARLIDARRFNTWPLIRSLSPSGSACLEVGPGLRPRLLIEGTRFVDLSEAAVEKLLAAGGDARVGSASALPFPDRAFDLACALDVVEHVDDDNAALAELSRVVKPGGRLLLSVPLHAAKWTAFDDFVGHRKRYEPAELAAQLAGHGFEVESSAAYGMLPRFPGLIDFGMRCLAQRRERAMWYYTHLFMPIGLCFQVKLRFVRGMISAPKIDEVLLVCRKL